MSKLRVSFEIETDMDASEVLDVLHFNVEAIAFDMDVGQSDDDVAAREASCCADLVEL